MKEPEPIPLDPNQPRAKKVQVTPMPKLYIDRMCDDIYIKTDNTIGNDIDEHENIKDCD